MMLGVAAIAFSAATGEEHMQWKAASRRECDRYNLPIDHVEARMQGSQLAGEIKPSRSAFDWLLVAGATGIFVVLATIARVPRMSLNGLAIAALSVAMLLLLIFSGLKLWRTTRFY